MAVVLIFLLGMLGAVRINLVGELRLNEVIVLIVAPVFARRALDLFKLDQFKRVAISGGMYVAGLIAADIYRATPPGDLLRGWAKLAVMFMAVPVLVVIMRGNERRILAYILGCLCVPVLEIMFEGAEYDVYKFYIGFPISAVSLLLLRALWPRMRHLALVFPLGAGMLALFNDSRSLAGITLVATMLAAKWLEEGRRSGQQSDQSPNLASRRLIASLVWIALATSIIWSIYVIGAPKGWFGDRAQEKFERQVSTSETGEFGILSGRSEMLFALPKILISPIIGYGSWAKDYDYVYKRAAELGMDRVSRHSAEDGLIPTHSHLLGGWLEAGLFGAIFWFLTARDAAIVLLRGSPRVFPLIAPLVAFYLFGFLWDVVFSPFGGERRLWNGFIIGLIALLRGACSANTHPYSKAQMKLAQARPMLPTGSARA